MLRKLTILGLLLFVLSDLFALDNGLALTPPMGWNSWNTFHCWDINEQLIMDVADSMVSKGLRDAGYEYVVIDDCWQTQRGADGVIIADPAKFPSGMKALADYVHSRGLKFGLYTCVGTNTCAGRPASYGYEEIDAQTYADWGVDYVKVDWCFSGGLDAKVQYTKFRDALLATGRPILFSICEWGENKPWEWAQNVGNMWRSTYDIVSCFDCNEFLNMGWSKIIEQNVNYAPYAGPGHWNDADMLEVGTAGLTETESLTHFVMWCMMASPLIAGNDVRTMDDYTVSVLTAPEIIAVNQDSLGIQGTRIKNENDLQVWQKPLKDGSIAIAFYNKSGTTAEMSVSLNELGFEADTAYIRDLWTRTDLGFVKDTVKQTVESHGVFIAKVRGKKLPLSSLLFDRDTIDVCVGNNAVIHASVSPSNSVLIFSASDNYCINTGIVGVNSYYISGMETGSSYVVIASLDGSASDTCIINVHPSTVPATWTFEDVNEFMGAASYDEGTFTLAAGGADIWGKLDQFGFLYKDTTGNIFISARLESIGNTDPWAKAGVMMRETSSGPGSNYFVFQTPSNGINLQWRYEFAGQTGALKKSGYSNPVYLKLGRYNNDFYYYVSGDGIEWTLLAKRTDETGFADDYKIGLAVTSHNSSVANTAKFSDINFGTFEEPTGTAEQLISDATGNSKLFPNPVKEKLTITNCYAGEMSYNILNLNGQLITEGTLRNDCREIDCSGFQSGFYILNLFENKKSIEHNMFVKVD